MATCFCIIVSFRPDVARLTELCSSLVAEGAAVVVVDNTETPSFDPARMPEGCTLIQLGYNSGIAHAQNVGVRAALEARAEIVLFFDQDSKVEAGFVASLVSALDPSVAEVVAPLCVDEATGMPLAAEDLGRFGWSKDVYRPEAKTRYPVDISISSGMAVTRRAVESVGPFDEDYFIDFVDSDWCLRCREKRVPIYVVPGVVMQHTIGSRHFNVGPLGISVHGPRRCYYQIRNCFLLFRKPHIPFLYSLKQLLGTLASRAVLTLFVDGRLAYLKAYLSGIRDGFMGRTGAGPA